VIYQRPLMAESGQSDLGPKRPLTTQSGHSSNRRNGYECSLRDDFNTQLADACSAQRYFRYVPLLATQPNVPACSIIWTSWAYLSESCWGMDDTS
jgi:hypothetical protein